MAAKLPAVPRGYFSDPAHLGQRKQEGIGTGRSARRYARGVEFNEEPVERFYGIDVGLRDPFGNPLRITQPAAVVVPPTTS